MTEEQKADMEKANNLLKSHVLKLMPTPGEYETSISGIRLYRRDKVTKAANCFYRPMIVKMIQGVKCLRIGTEEYKYGQNEVLVAGVDLPGSSMVLEASVEEPSIALVIDLDKNLIAQLALEIPQKPLQQNIDPKALLIQPLEMDMLDAFLRLAQLFDKPDKLPILAPMLIKEIPYLLLIGPHGQQLSSFHIIGSQSNQVAQAISWLKQNIATAIQIEELAGKVNMAPSTFHRHFRKVTSLSPLQYQKQLRLHEAQKLMFSNNLDANNASIAVGYDSLSQFTREYKRHFGEPPRRDIKRLQDKHLLSATLNPATFSSF